MAKSKVQQVIDLLMSAQDVSALDNIIFNDVSSLSQEPLRKRAMIVAKARRLQLEKAPVYKIGADNAAYLQRALKDAAPGLDSVFVFNFNSDILKGRYLVACDSYRLHCISAASMPIGSYHLYGDSVYLATGDHAIKSPDFSFIPAHSHRSFLTKTRWMAGTDLNAHIFRMKDSSINMVRLSADKNKLKLGGPETDHVLPFILQFDYLQDAVTNRDCTILLGFGENEPVVIIDSSMRLAFLMPMTPPKGHERRRHREDAFADQMDRRFNLCMAAAAFGVKMIGSSPDGYSIDGQEFNDLRAAARYYAYTLLELDRDRLPCASTRVDPVDAILSDTFDLIKKGDWQ